MKMDMERVSSNKSFGGTHQQFRHTSNALNCGMRFAIYLPETISTKNPMPVLYWLSGLTCTDENFMQKAGAHQLASQLGIVIVAPDTSPRGENVADDEAYDLGQGAGFYINATQAPWDAHYRMYDYITLELPKIIQHHFPVSDVKSISGHSMGGHGAIMIALRNPDKYRSASAFSPICNPINSPWGQKAFSAYLGSEKHLWNEYDSCELIKRSILPLPIKVDQGTADSFLEEQLNTKALIDAAESSNYPIEINLRDAYDHSYYFIASFISEHLAFHLKHLSAQQ